MKKRFLDIQNGADGYFNVGGEYDDSAESPQYEILSVTVKNNHATEARVAKLFSAIDGLDSSVADVSAAGAGAWPFVGQAQTVGRSAAGGTCRSSARRPRRSPVAPRNPSGRCLVRSHRSSEGRDDCDGKSFVPASVVPCIDDPSGCSAHYTVSAA